MAVDEPSLLPKLPPPRPAGRDAAIGAAMRRFDGDAPEVEAIPARPRRAWLRHPQAGLAISASLVAVIGIPAALIAIRDGPVPAPPSYERADEAPATRRAEPQPEPQAAADSAEESPPPVSTARPEPNRFPVLPDGSAPASAARETDADYAAPAPPVAVARPPPPPAPTIEPSMQQEAEDQSIVVTGSRIQAPAFEGSRLERKSVGRSSSERTGAPGWVLNNREYRDFLSRLQSAIRSEQRSAVTGMIAYPLRVNAAGGSRSYRSAASVLADYEQIFTPRVKAAILAQRFENLFGRDQGVMIGDGAVWFDHMCRGRDCARRGAVRITAINP